ncbi:glycosyltransferase family 2 protein [Echinicola jeungdonensis]|uniref:Glycosyltransferase family 2 protein n=1 Tax=Echinicola jeungdonensis TaxID=709343 RepID=A0ABV5J814_9BACT|nr:glycosyltransferase family 2 protein [Echinicola jeungdonensis]MDN3669968.1 glycosyltransferase family 2 protein [Echinicola jeungdonensis]
MAQQPNPFFSVVCPVYKTRHQLEELVDRLEAVFNELDKDFEVILVDDGCPEDSWDLIALLTQKNDFIKGVKLSRNFGQHYAITAGLDQSMGQWVIVMDADLQDLPEEIPSLYKKAKEGFQVVVAKRKERKDGRRKRWASWLFYKILSYLTRTSMDHQVANFGIYHAQVIEEIKRLKEQVRYFPALVQWVGFRQVKVEVKHGDNSGRVSAYSWEKMVDLALNIMMAYSDRPLRMMVKLGLMVALIGFLYAGYTLFKYWLGEIIVAGYASLIVSIWVLTGVLLITLGMVGLYVGKTYQGVKNRPLYIIEKKL